MNKKKHNIIPSWEITHDSNLVWFWDIIYNFKYTTLIILGILLNFRNKIHDFNHSWDLVKFLIHNINPWLVWDIFTILNPRHYSWLVFTSEIRWISTHDTNHVWARKSKNTTLVRFPALWSRCVIPATPQICVDYEVKKGGRQMTFADICKHEI